MGCECVCVCLHWLGLSDRFLILPCKFTETPHNTAYLFLPGISGRASNSGFLQLFRDEKYISYMLHATYSSQSFITVAERKELCLLKKD